MYTFKVEGFSAVSVNSVAINFNGVISSPSDPFLVANKRRTVRRKPNLNLPNLKVST